MRLSAGRPISLALGTVLLATLVSTPALASPRIPHAAISQPGTLIAVTRSTDIVDAGDGLCSFSEAITAANDNVPSGDAPGECPAGAPDNADTITVDPSFGGVDMYANGPQITGNVIIDGGGRIFYTSYRPFDIASGARVTIRHFGVQNSATSDDGAAMRVAGTVTLEDARFVIVSTTAKGGSIWVEPSGSLTINGATFDSSSATGNGGAIWNQGTLSMTDVLTSSVSTDGDGGFLYNDLGATAIIKDSQIWGGTAPSGNGGGVANLGSLVASNTVFAINAASGSGGAVYDDGALHLVHSTVVGNQAGAGSGISSTGTPLVTNSIVAVNPVSGNDAGIDGTLDAGSTGNVTTLPAGTTLGDWLSNSLVPLNVAGSPILDAADDGVCAAAPVSRLDIRGLARPAGACDVGAYERDKVAPVVSTAPRASFVKGQLLDGSKAVARISWAGSDPTGGSGLYGWEVEVRVNSGAWTSVVTPEPPYTSRTTQDVKLSSGSSYRFRVRGTDNDGNVSAWSYTPTFTARLVQQTSSAITYRGTWTRADSTKFSGGSVRYAKAQGASATYTATGRAYAFVTTTGPKRGKAKIYVNGSLKATVDLYSATSRYRVQAWSIRYSTSASRTIKVVVVGTTDRPRVDLDAFYVMR